LIGKDLCNKRKACASLGLSRSTYYRLSEPAVEKAQKERTRAKPPRTLSVAEREKVLAVLHEDRFVDKPPGQIYAALLDEGRYLCSVSTMYRILNANGEVKERRNQLSHPNYKKPELLATGPNQVWSWDITKLKGPAKWTCYYLYVIIDIYSRYVVGWMLASRQTGALAKSLIKETCKRQHIKRSQLIIHSDRGGPMTSKALALLMSDLGITKSLNRPYVSNDNPYSESQFKTLKYRPAFPDRFGCIEDARTSCGDLLDWYNNDHYHTGVALMTPATVHYGRAEQCTAGRQAVLTSAYHGHPERFVNGQPKPLALPLEVWINKPEPRLS
jgi:putative transposase